MWFQIPTWVILAPLKIKFKVLYFLHTNVSSSAWIMSKSCLEVDVAAQSSLIFVVASFQFWMIIIFTSKLRFSLCWCLYKGYLKLNTFIASRNSHYNFVKSSSPPIHCIGFYRPWVWFIFKNLDQIWISMHDLPRM